ncbi:hypothetical protein BJ912DRAFT_1060626 [Pholiota molesta]|nr:hypothetical protein BJ912DRAFT_1060626 [Pholiota molesta]
MPSMMALHPPFCSQFGLQRYAFMRTSRAPSPPPPPPPRLRFCWHAGRAKVFALRECRSGWQTRRDRLDNNRDDGVCPQAGCSSSLVDAVFAFPTPYVVLQSHTTPYTHRIHTTFDDIDDAALGLQASSVDVDARRGAAPIFAQNKSGIHVRQRFAHRYRISARPDRGVTSTCGKTRWRKVQGSPEWSIRLLAEELNNELVNIPNPLSCAPGIDSVSDSPERRGARAALVQSG